MLTIMLTIMPSKVDNFKTTRQIKCFNRWRRVGVLVILGTTYNTNQQICESFAATFSVEAKEQLAEIVTNHLLDKNISILDSLCHILQR